MDCGLGTESCEWSQAAGGSLGIVSLELSATGFPCGCSGGVVCYSGAWLLEGMLGLVRSGSGLDFFLGRTGLVAGIDPVDLFTGG